MFWWLKFPPPYFWILSSSSGLHSEGTLLPKLQSWYYMAHANTLPNHLRGLWVQSCRAGTTWLMLINILSHPNPHSSGKAAELVRNKDCPDNLRWECLFIRAIGGHMALFSCEKWYTCHVTTFCHLWGVPKVCVVLVEMTGWLWWPAGRIKKFKN